MEISFIQLRLQMKTLNRNKAKSLSRGLGTFGTNTDSSLYIGGRNDDAVNPAAAGQANMIRMGVQLADIKIKKK